MDTFENLRSECINGLLKHVDKKKATELEKSIYDFSVDYANVHETQYLIEQIYETKADEIINMIQNKETGFLNHIKKGTINLANVAFMKPDELNPDKYNKIIKKKNTEADKINNQVTTTVYTCKKCKNNKCQATQRQTRSADEPATTFVTCMECGYEFTICN